jgi:hypothetical protein
MVGVRVGACGHVGAVLVRMAVGGLLVVLVGAPPREAVAARVVGRVLRSIVALHVRRAIGWCAHVQLHQSRRLESIKSGSRQHTGVLRRGPRRNQCCTRAATGVRRQMGGAGRRSFGGERGLRRATTAGTGLYTGGATVKATACVRRDREVEFGGSRGGVAGELQRTRGAVGP